MARVIEYKDRKRYFTELKMGRSWREREVGKKRERRKMEEERPKDSGTLTKRKRK